MRTLITGGAGMLAADVRKRFERAGHEVVAVDLPDFDITDIDATLTAIRALKPELVVHCAAATDVDGCEKNPDFAYRVNALGSWNVATACAEIGASIVAISTDFVFDGKKTEPYTEFDAPHPLGAYAASKLAGEQLVREACPRHYVVRTSWLYGAGGKCFPKTMLRLAETRTELTVVGDQFGTPAFTGDVAELIVDIVKVPLYGTYHAANTGVTTWAGFAEAILRGAGRGNVTVKPILASEWPTPTERPAYSALRGYVRELQGKAPMRPWQEALSDFLAEIGSGNYSG